ncbi:MAG: UDP-3-O-(3-hydroxymyristoyl)glucosamine N-acyltransferase [Mesorhizobium sp.]|nr:UDP-3-O-(3-hydroxymyristoyl)glucosamine N-acyltransferase [Mesorhizobium sp.]
MTDPVFFEPSRRFTAGEVAALTGAELANPDMAHIAISGVAGLEEGGDEKLVFIESKRQAASITTISAAALLCPPGLQLDLLPSIAVLFSDRPRAAFARIAGLLFPPSVTPVSMTGEAGISPLAHVAPDARLEEDVIVEAGAVIGAGVAIGRGTIIAPNAVIGANCQIGRGCHIGAGATVQFALLGDRVVIGPGSRIGQDGFGYIPGANGLDKVPQLGRVVIQDRVDIGANTTIDRGALSDTVIGEGTKIDNLVQIAHNCQIGRHCIIAGQVGLSGSVRLGDGAMLGGGAGIADHVTIGAGAAVAASGGVMHDIPPRERWGGTPARPIKQLFREQLALRKLAGSRTTGRSDD